MLLKRSLFDVVHVSVVVLLSLRVSTGQLNDSPPDCQAGIAGINKCISAASAAVNATGCNWYRLIGPLDDCIREAVAGCNYDEQEVWYGFVRDYNITLTSDDCYPSCTNQIRRSQQMYQCFSDADFEQLVNDLHSRQNVQSSDLSCRALSAMTTCLLVSTSGCPALTDITYDRILSAPYSASVFSACGVALFQAATTNAPVALLDPNSMLPDTISATGSPGALQTSETLLVIFGSIFIIATIIVIIIVIILAIRRRRAAHNRSILKDWRPNGQTVYRDEPQFMPAQNTNLYRPITISHNSGFLEDPAHVQ